MYWTFHSNIVQQSVTLELMYEGRISCGQYGFTQRWLDLLYCMGQGTTSQELSRSEDECSVGPR